MATSKGETTRGAAPMDETYLAELREEFPGLRVIDKAEDRFSRWVDRALRVLTLGGQDAYMTRYVTTIRRSIYLPVGWAERTPENRYITLRHEAVHLRQFRRYGFVPLTFLYLIPIAPLGLALGRARLEWEAYAETLRATAEVKGTEAAASPTLHAHIKKQFVGPAYGWMWPFPNTIQRWIDATVEELRRQAPAPREER